MTLQEITEYDRIIRALILSLIATGVPTNEAIQTVIGVSHEN